MLALHFIGNAEPLDGSGGVFYRLMQEGGHGVDLFFVLSGFLITGILWDSVGTPRWLRNFFARRALRIFPLYYGVLAVVFFAAPLISAFDSPQFDYQQEHQLWAWLYAVNLFVAREGKWALGNIDHFWSLAVEEQFYLVWPFVVLGLRAHPRAFLGVTLSLTVLAILGRVVAFELGVNWWATVVLTPFRLDCLAFGAFVAVLVRQPAGLGHLRRALPLSALLLGVALIVTVGWGLSLESDHTPAHVLRLGLIELACGLFVAAVVTAPPGSTLIRWLEWSPLVRLGVYSYGVYVYHHFVSHYLVTERLHARLAPHVGGHLPAVLLQAAAGTAVSVGVAAASYEWFEARFLALKRRFAD